MYNVCKIIYMGNTGMGRNPKRGGNASYDLYLLKALNNIIAVINGQDLVPANRTHNTVIAVGAGVVPKGTLRGSVLNQGNVDGVWNGINLPAGVSVPWGDIVLRDRYNAIQYDATGTTFVIEYTT